MTDALAADKGERTDARFGYRFGYYTRTACHPGWHARAAFAAGSGRPLLERALRTLRARSEQALVSTLAEMYLQGASTREVKAVPRSCAAIPSRKRRKRCQ
jgi:putative transposase